MKKVWKWIIIGLLTIFTLLSCSLLDGNYQNVRIQGRVIDSNTQKPIKNAILRVGIWTYNTTKWESDLTNLSTQSNTEGYYLVSYPKAEAFDIEVIVDGYLSQKKSITLDNNMLELDFKMIQE